MGNMSDYQPLRASQVPQRLREVMQYLEDATDAFSQAADEAAEAEAEWKIAEAKYHVTHDGAVSKLEREAKAKHEDLYRKYKITAALRESALERVRTARGGLSSVQTAAGSFKDQYQAANQTYGP